MGVPARDSAAAREPADPDKHDPRARGWADVQVALTAAADALALAAAELPRGERDDPALAMVETTGRAVKALGVIAGRWVVDEAVLAAERRRGFDEGYAACRAARYRLEVVDGGQAAPGPR